MNPNEPINTSRAVNVIRIPSGEKVLLPAETPVVITQALGGSYTLLVMTESGLFRLAAEDADAIGKTPVVHDATAAEGPVKEETIWTTLKTCYDPEIPVNIVDLGLIYDCKITPAENGSNVAVKMTLTAPGCGMGPVLAREAEEKITALSGVASANVELVWDPPWSPDRISAEGREKLGMV